MTQDLLYQIALTLVPNIGCIQAKILIENYKTAENIFKAKKKDYFFIVRLIEFDLTHYSPRIYI